MNTTNNVGHIVDTTPVDVGMTIQVNIFNDKACVGSSQFSFENVSVDSCLALEKVTSCNSEDDICSEFSGSIQLSYHGNKYSYAILLFNLIAHFSFQNAVFTFINIYFNYPDILKGSLMMTG